MKGYIKITAEPAEGGSITAMEVNLQDFSFADKTCLINAFLKGLNIPPRGSRASSSGYSQRAC